MRKLFAYLKDKLRDRMAESNELRRLAVKCKAAYYRKGIALLDKKKELVDKYEIEATNLHQKWEILAKSYEDKWLK
jgi:hypothetical protein